MVKLISWDVGIRNLAYCVLDSEALDHPVVWSVLDLTCPSVCSSCFEGATLMFEDKPFCGKHCSAPPRPNDMKKASLAKLSKTALLKLAERLKVHIQDTVRKPSLIEDIDRHLNNTYAMPLRKQNANFVPMAELCRVLNDKLEGLDVDDIPICIIEQQMKARMIAVGSALCMWFTMHGKEVSFISPTHKLQVGSGDVKKRTYKQRKSEAVRLTSERVDAYWKPRFMSNSKKDDLADCYLQGVWFALRLNEEERG